MHINIIIIINHLHFLYIKYYTKKELREYNIDNNNSNNDEFNMSIRVKCVYFRCDQKVVFTFKYFNRKEKLNFVIYH